MFVLDNHRPVHPDNILSPKVLPVRFRSKCSMKMLVAKTNAPILKFSKNTKKSWNTIYNLTLRTKKGPLRVGRCKRQRRSCVVKKRHYSSWLKTTRVTPSSVFPPPAWPTSWCATWRRAATTTFGTPSWAWPACSLSKNYPKRNWTASPNSTKPSPTSTTRVNPRTGGRS